MSHFSEYSNDAKAPDGRALGDEWVGWNGKDGGTVQAGRGLFITVSAVVIVLMGALACLFVYLISPRLAIWQAWLPAFAWIVAGLLVAISVVSLVMLVITVFTERSAFPFRRGAFFLFDLVFSHAFRFAGFLKISRDRLGHSFVRVSNSVARAFKIKGRDEKLLILLPRCLSKDELKEVNELKSKYPLEIHTVSGGELARKKVKELRPTAVIGVACERDLVSGIRDVGSRISVIGIPNQRPEGPCKNTHIDMAELISAIEFYVGRPGEK